MSILKNIKIQLVFYIQILCFIINTNITLAQIEYNSTVRTSRTNHPNISYERDWRATPINLALARICLSEEGYQDLDQLYNPAGCIAIYHVLISRTGELTLDRMKAYSPKSFNFRRSGRTRYIPYLNSIGREPLYWYSSLDWERFRQRWIEIYEVATRLAEGIPVGEYPCDGPVHHWGAPTRQMVARARRNGLIRVQCEGVLNYYWRIPGRKQRPTQILNNQV